jgi:hypothetical protein
LQFTCRECESNGGVRAGGRPPSFIHDGEAGRSQRVKQVHSAPQQMKFAAAPGRDSGLQQVARTKDPYHGAGTPVGRMPAQ